ncbi:MAG TPA: DNA polymerase I [Bacteroidales bacterium]|nr:DNA polymerase I [Bacteroidales bacterium]HOX73319.1 DNA polymerase I [Bacteroidales bacterium]HPM86583.1 DNA polymerase I [Bacteroidales bacterium]HQM67859.1 DNA polymerase I [Bacteroidales bacterium]
MQDNQDKKLFLLDAYALIFRSYYAFIRNPRLTSKGLNTSAIFGFLLTLEEVLQKQRPTHIAVVFDVSGPTFRHEMYKEYKANRDETPEDIKTAVPYIKRLIEAYRIPVIDYPGFEADDVIGTLAKKASARGFTTYMMTPDKDFAQLVSGNIFMYKPSRSGNESVIWGIEDIKREFEVERPEQVIDILALMGDTADNIPGAPGVGPKTAMKLISEYGSVEELFKNTDKLKGRLKEIIEDNREKIELSKKLATIIVDVPVDLEEENLVTETPDVQKLKVLFEELEFKTAASRILSNASAQQSRVADKSQPQPQPQPQPQNPQGTLFSDDLLESAIDRSSLKDINSVQHDYKLISDNSELKQIIDLVLQKKEICFDTETTSIDALQSEIVALALSWEKHKGYLVHFAGNERDTEEKLEIIRPLFENPSILKIGQNCKFDIQVLENYGINVKGPLFDTMIAHYLLEPDMRHNMNLLSEIYLSYTPVHIESLIGEKGQNQKNMRAVPPEQIREYAVEDADVTLQLKEVFESRIREEGLSELATEIEMPLINVLASMERNGVILDEAELKRITADLRDDIITLEKDIYLLAGTEFNISSPKQLGDILFLRLKLDDKARMTKTKQFVTNEEILQRLAHKHPIVDKVLEYRGLKKLLSTYVEALPQLINKKTGRIHTSFNQAVASTGRLSSNNPNLQNIPVRDERGREIRKAFIPAEGCIFFSADYSQIELRLMAHLSGDKSMISDFLSGSDIHAATAAKIFGVDISKVTREMRSRAKTANFGIIYGISSFGLSERLTIGRKEAKDLIDGYFASYPGVKTYMDDSIRKAREKGYVTTMFGRRRYLRDIHSRNQVVRGNAERNAINAPIQGSAADIIKIAMVRIHEKLQKENYKSRMILQVHDELIFEVPDSELGRLREMVIYEMSNAAILDVPLKVDWGTGRNWLEAH